MDTMFFDDMVLRHTKGVKYAMKKKTMEKFEKLNEHNEVYEVPVAAEPVVVVKYEECPICCTSVPESTIHYADTGAACGHGACVTCWKTWVDSQLPACRRNFQIRVRCMACPRTLDQSLVFEVSEAACKLAENLHRRFQLQDNPQATFLLGCQLEAPPQIGVLHHQGGGPAVFQDVEQFFHRCRCPAHRIGSTSPHQTLIRNQPPRAVLGKQRHQIAGLHSVTMKSRSRSGNAIGQLPEAEPLRMSCMRSINSHA